MKTLKLFSIIAMLMSIALPSPALGNSEEERATIPLRKQGITPPHRHRSPALMPIAAEYDGFLSAVVVNFRKSVGDVTADVMNLSTGECVSQSLDGTGLAYIPVSCNEGIYTITFTLASGTQYTGQFIL